MSTCIFVKETLLRKIYRSRAEVLELIMTCQHRVVFGHAAFVNVINELTFLRSTTSDYC
jgi:hypothetical protein